MSAPLSTPRRFNPFPFSTLYPIQPELRSRFRAGARVSRLAAGWSGRSGSETLGSPVVATSCGSGEPRADRHATFGVRVQPEFRSGGARAAGPPCPAARRTGSRPDQKSVSAPEEIRTTGLRRAAEISPRAAGAPRFHIGIRVKPLRAMRPVLPPQGDSRVGVHGSRRDGAPKSRVLRAFSNATDIPCVIRVGLYGRNTLAEFVQCCGTPAAEQKQRKRVDTLLSRRV
jgi:hypothetical protein